MLTPPLLLALEAWQVHASLALEGKLVCWQEFGVAAGESRDPSLASASLPPFQLQCQPPFLLGCQMGSNSLAKEGREGGPGQRSL